MTRITTRFGFHSTASEVIEGVDLAGKRAIVTGGAAELELKPLARWSMRARTSPWLFGAQTRLNLSLRS